MDISDFPQKRAVLQESLALMRRHGNELQIGNTLTWLSEIEFSAGDWPSAFEYGREAVRHAESSGSIQLYARTMVNLASYAGALGDWDTARQGIAKAIAAGGKRRNQELTSYAVQAAAVVAAGLGRDDDAARLAGWCEARVGVLHTIRQADQSEDICYRRLIAGLRERMGDDELARTSAEGATMSEEEALALAVSV
jgi:tetratricopeptide (TPR) repeat protein